jgi:cytidylate kinase
MKKIIVTISREFGSGGRTVGFLLAEQLGFKFYDKAVILIAAEKTGISPELMENVESSAAASFMYNLSQASYAPNMQIISYDSTPNGEVFAAQSEVIREIAAQESAVIIGCCADFILKDEPGLVSVYLHAKTEDKFRRLTDSYGLSQKEAKEQLKKVDKGRDVYYRTFTGEERGNAGNFDLYINTSRTGIEGAVAAIKALVLAKMK